jgi:predicted metal-dependent phosphoesterase TrpH
MMKIDFHVHASVSKNQGFDFDTFRNLIKYAKRMDLDAVALTEHFDNPDFKRIYPILDRKFPYVGSYYVAKGLKIFPGVEISINEGPHLLAIGDRDSVLKYYKRIPKKSNRKPLCSAKAFFEY